MPGDGRRYGPHNKTVSHAYNIHVVELCRVTYFNIGRYERIGNFIFCTQNMTFTPPLGSGNLVWPISSWNMQDRGT